MRNISCLNEIFEHFKSVMYQSNHFELFNRIPYIVIEYELIQMIKYFGGSKYLICPFINHLISHLCLCFCFCFFGFRNFVSSWNLTAANKFVLKLSFDSKTHYSLFVDKMQKQTTRLHFNKWECKNKPKVIPIARRKRFEN